VATPISFQTSFSFLVRRPVAISVATSLIFSKAQKIPITGIRAIVLTADRMEENMSHVAIPLFDGESYDLWAVRMQTYLEGLDL